MDRPKPLPSSLREKKRYVVFEVISDEEVSIDVLAEEIYRHGIELLGELGLSRLSMWVMKNMFNGSRGIVRVRPGGVEETRLILASIRQVDEVPAIISVVGVTGTIRAAKVRYLS